MMIEDPVAARWRRRASALQSVPISQHSGMTSSTPHLPAAILSCHAHLYDDPVATRATAEALRQRIAERFAVQLGRWHDAPVGPHTRAMDQVAFAPPLFASVVPWLMLHREGPDVRVHPNTLAPRADPLQHALWLGDRLALKDAVLPWRIEAAQESPIVPNTTPQLAP
jgi:DOPA 4,5-dioxygenase